MFTSCCGIKSGRADREWESTEVKNPLLLKVNMSSLYQYLFHETFKSSKFIMRPLFYSALMLVVIVVASLSIKRLDKRQDQLLDAMAKGNMTRFLGSSEASTYHA